MKSQLGVEVTVKDLKEVMKEHYKLLNWEENEDVIASHTNEHSKNKNSNENGRRRHKRFVGACNNCEVSGHKMKDC